MSRNPKLTRAQLEVLRLLAAGWVMEPAGRDGIGGLLFDGTGQSRNVSGKTVSFLFNNLYISVGDIYFPWVLTKQGQEAIAGLKMGAAP